MVDYLFIVVESLLHGFGEDLDRFNLSWCTQQVCFEVLTTLLVDGFAMSKQVLRILKLFPLFLQVMQVFVKLRVVGFGGC